MAFGHQSLLTQYIKMAILHRLQLSDLKMLVIFGSFLDTPAGLTAALPGEVQDATHKRNTIIKDTKQLQKQHIC